MGAFFTPGRRCPPDQRSLSDRRLPLHNGQPLPRCNLPPAELLITEHTKIHFRSPVRPFPRPSFPGGTGTLRLSPGLRTPRSPTTHARAGTVHRTLDRITSSSTDLQTA